MKDWKKYEPIQVTVTYQTDDVLMDVITASPGGGAGGAWPDGWDVGGDSHDFGQ